MNIHEAEEIVRNKSVIAKDPSQWAGYLRAREVLIETMLSWLDPTPISEDLLRANGWVQGDFENQYLNGKLEINWCEHIQAWIFDDGPIIQTLGELRTLLRLMGEMK